MAATDNQEVKKTNRERMNERLRSRFPDRQFDDDEAFFGQINDDYDDYDKQISGYRDREKTFSDLFTGDRRSAVLFNRWRNGEDPLVQFIRLFGSEIKDKLDDPAFQEEIAAANKEYLDRITENEKYEAEYAKNREESAKADEEFQSENGLTDEQMDSVYAFIGEMVRDVVSGKITKETLAMAWKAVNHDADVEEAAAEAEVKGRNAKIRETLRKGKRGDGVPQLSGQGAAAPAGPKKDMGALGRYDGGYQDIYERGGFKRK